MKPTEVLMQEHRAIERLLAVLESACDDLEQGAPVPPQVFADALEFVRVFADQCHHGKEEETLFPLLESHDVPRDGGPLGTMLGEHDQGRAYVRAMGEALGRFDQPGAKEDFIENARSYSELLHAHIAKEDDVLFPMADMLLSDQEQDALARQFERVEDERIGPREHARMEALLESLERGYQSPVTSSQ